MARRLNPRRNGSMPLRNLVCTLLLVALPQVSASAVDLTKIDRALVKEPKYRSAAVKYCLLVFGPEAKTRVWLVQDGDTLYVDRNGNGDLTEEHEKIAAEKDEGAADGRYSFKVGEVRDGALTHKELFVYVSKPSLDSLAEEDKLVKAFRAKHPDAPGYEVFVDVEMPGWK